MMKIVFFSPYLTEKRAGGGEKHLFDTALAVAASGCQVFVAISPLYQQQKKKTLDLQEYKAFYARFLGRQLDQLRFIETPLMSQASFWQKLFWTKQFDQLYYVTDGSLFFSLAKKNHLHIQIPLLLPQSGLINRLKLSRWQLKNTNSQFTKQVIEKNWRTKIDFVHYPLVQLDELDQGAKKKSKLILSVGRFFRQLHSKRQDILVEAFKQLVDQQPELFHDWRLILVGAVEDEAYFNRVKKMAQGYQIEFYPQVERKRLIELFQKATFYWHAAGYDIDELKEPEKVEHFGITTIEAIAAGALPLVVPKGGQKEIIGQKLIKQLGWQTVPQLVRQTTFLLEQKTLRQNILKELKSSLARFGPVAFQARVEKMFLCEKD